MEEGKRRWKGENEEKLAIKTDWLLQKKIEEEEKEEKEKEKGIRDRRGKTETDLEKKMIMGGDTEGKK